MFQPYNRHQLETIAKTRLDGLNVFESRAIEYAARKVRQPSSDNLIIDPVQLLIGLECAGQVLPSQSILT